MKPFQMPACAPPRLSRLRRLVPEDLWRARQAADALGSAAAAWGVERVDAGAAQAALAGSPRPTADAGELERRREEPERSGGAGRNDRQASGAAADWMQPWGRGERDKQGALRLR